MRLPYYTAVEHVRRMDPYGNPRGPQPTSWPGQETFVGGIDDPTGLIHIGARSYDPTIGRFLSADSILNPSDDQQINGYAYADNNPIIYTDPTGMFTDANGVPCIDGDCSYHNPEGSVKSVNQCSASGGCGNGYGSSTVSYSSSNGGAQDEALDYFFGPAPESQMRHEVQTDAIAPGNGVVVARFFISHEVFYGIGMGDNRTFSTDVDAGYRVVLAWDTDTGRLSYTADETCLVGYCDGPKQMNDGNHVEVLSGNDGDLAVVIAAQNAFGGPHIDQELRVSIHDNGSVGVRVKGDPYPDFEAIAYRGNAKMDLGTSPHATPGGPLVQLPPMASDRDLAWVDGALTWQDGRHVASSGMGMTKYCLSNPALPGC